MTDASRYDRWTALDDDAITISLVEDLLSPVQDDLWVAAACADRILDDVEVQRALIDLGIERTESAIGRVQDALSEAGSNSDEQGNSPESLASYFSDHVTDAHLCRIRNILISRRDRLRNFEEVVGNAIPLRSSVTITGNPTSDEEESWDDPWTDENAESGPSFATVKQATPPLPLSVFLTESIPVLCLSLAAQAQIAALKVLMKWHFMDAYPFRLEIVSTIPLFTDPAEYRDLLPALDARSGRERTYEQNACTTEVDLSESDVVQRAISLANAFPEQSMIEDFDVEQAFHLQAHALSAEELLSWYKDRVENIVASTGLVDIALSLVQHGVSQGILRLDELGEDLTLISRLVYDASKTDGTPSEPISLREWASLEPHDVIKRYLAHATPDTIVSDIRRLVMPYLFVLESRCERAGKPDSSLVKHFVYNYILNTKLELVVPVFEASKPTQIHSQRIISDDEDLARLALACLYGSDSLDEWTYMSRIFECLPAWSSATHGDEEHEADTTVASLTAYVAPTTSRLQVSTTDLFVFFEPLPAHSLSRALDVLDVHLESGGILSRWGVPVPLRWFLQSAHDDAQQRAWAVKMAQQPNAPTVDPDSEDTWKSLLEDMLTLARSGQDETKSAFGALSKDTIRQIFFRGLLSTGRFIIARHLFQPRHGKRLLDPDTIERICLDCSREFYDNANSGNYNFGDMKLAYDCLAVAPQTYRIQKEREFIEATSRISSFNVTSRPGVPLLPIEIRLSKDKLSLISRVLSSNESAYKHVEVLLELVRKLGYQGDGLAEVKTLAMVADAALQAEDFPRAFESSERMINAALRLRQNAPLGVESEQVTEAVEVCWVACYQLGRQSEAHDVERKMMLLGRALELCPAERIVDILTSWRKLESEEVELRQERIDKCRLRDEDGAKRPGHARGRTATLSSRLQNSLHMPSPALPSASALASHTFSRVAAAFPFTAHGRSGEERSRGREGSPDVQSQARHVLRKGVDWLIGADENEF